MPQLRSRTATQGRDMAGARGVKACKPVGRKHDVSAALRAYAALTTNAARGAVRDLAQIRS